MLCITSEKPSDIRAREALLDAAFGPERFEKTCERLREGRLPARGLSLVAREGGVLVGTLRFWHVETATGHQSESLALAGCEKPAATFSRPALMLGPLAVAESHRSLGVGGQLMRRGLSLAGALGHKAVLLVGDEAYYRRFGFSRALAEGLDLPGWYDARRFLGLELCPGGLAGASGMVRATGLPDPAIGLALPPQAAARNLSTSKG
jgi:predicted N-acetyltransferase YhbS